MKVPTITARSTLNKEIAAAATHADKVKLALIGGKAATPIQMLPLSAALLRKTLPDAEWKKGAIERLKQQFADVLFPALMKDDTSAFEELIEAMAARRRGLDYIIPHRRGKPGKKKEAGRRLRLALLTLDPEDRQSIQTVLDRLSEDEIEYSDESHVRRVMREIRVGLLVPGQRCHWYIGKKLVRELRMEADGSLTNEGQSRKDLAAVMGKKLYVEVIVRDADK